MGCGLCQSSAERGLGEDGGRARTWWPVRSRHLPLCAFFLFSANQPPPPLFQRRFRGPQVACNVWWWKASVMDLLYIQAHLNWCDSSAPSPDWPLYCLCLGANACWMDEFHYRGFCQGCVRSCVRVCICVCSLLNKTWIMLHVWSVPRWVAECVRLVYLSTLTPVCGDGRSILNVAKAGYTLCDFFFPAVPDERQPLCEKRGDIFRSWL